MLLIIQFNYDFNFNFHRFIGSEDPETYFTDTERVRVCYEIIETAPYGKKQKGEIGIYIYFCYHRYIGSDDPEKFFPDRERVRICYEILERVSYARRHLCEIGMLH